VRAVPGHELDVSVVVPSHERPVRLRWLLNALEDQTLPRNRWELMVVHDSRGNETEQLLREHPLAAAGLLRQFRLPAGSGSPGRQRNVGWRAARAPLIAFTDDDCRPDPDWLARLLEAARRNPEAILQGRVRPDPFETDVLAAPHARTIEVDPPGPFAQTCNVLYPRELLESVAGFKESLRSGEDTDLAERAIATGARYVGVPEALVFHAVESSSIVGAVTRSVRWQDLAYVVKHHPHVRERLDLGVFWRRSHTLLAAAAACATVTRRRGPTLVAAAPYVVHVLRRRGTHKRGLARAAVEAPGRLVIDGAEIATLAAGSVRYRTLFL
jgi:GT2 family glycosyltransferase